MKPLLVAILIMTAGGSSYAQTTNFFELSKAGTPQQVQAAIEQGADIYARDKLGNAVLMLAAGYNRRPEMITTLLKAGADIKAQNKNGWTPLMFATEFNHNPEI